MIHGVIEVLDVPALGEDYRAEVLENALGGVAIGTRAPGLDAVLYGLREPGDALPNQVATAFVGSPIVGPVIVVDERLAPMGGGINDKDELQHAWACIVRPYAPQATRYTASELNDIVGGCFTYVHLEANMVMVVNEDGMLHRLRVNRMASLFAARVTVGSVLICPVELVQA